MLILQSNSTQLSHLVFVFYKYGAVVRGKCRFAAESGRYLRALREKGGEKGMGSGNGEGVGKGKR